MKAKDKTEEVLKSIHVLFSKAEPIEGSKKKVIIDRDRMMKLLKDLNSCMYSMMDEYEMTAQSKEKATRNLQKQNDEMIFDARKNAEDIYAASLMYTDHALDEIQTVIDKTKADLSALNEKFCEDIEAKKQELKDNQLDLKSKLGDLIDRQKYLKLIESENLRLQREAEKKAEEADWEEPVEKVVPEIHINEEYFKSAGLLEDTKESEDEIEIDPKELEDLDNEYFAWKEEGKSEDTETDEPKKSFFGFGRK